MYCFYNLIFGCTIHFLNPVFTNSPQIEQMQFFIFKIFEHNLRVVIKETTPLPSFSEGVWQLLYQQY